MSLCFFHLGFELLKFCVAEMGGCACMMRLLLITSIWSIRRPLGIDLLKKNSIWLQELAGKSTHLDILQCRLTFWGLRYAFFFSFICYWNCQLVYQLPDLYNASVSDFAKPFIKHQPFCWHRLDLTLFSLHESTTKTERNGKMRKALRLSGGVLRVSVHLHRCVPLPQSLCSSDVLVELIQISMFCFETMFFWLLAFEDWKCFIDQILCVCRFLLVHSLRIMNLLLIISTLKLMTNPLLCK